MTDEKVSNALTGAAGVHFVVSEPSLCGLIALPTIRNTPGYDVIVVRSDGKRHANIQVKTTRNKANFFLMPSPSKIRTGPRDFYAYVRWLKAEKRFEAFLLTGLEAKLEVERSVGEQQARKRRKGTTRHMAVAPRS